MCGKRAVITGMEFQLSICTFRLWLRYWITLSILRWSPPTRWLCRVCPFFGNFEVILQCGEEQSNEWTNVLIKLLQATLLWWKTHLHPLEKFKLVQLMKEKFKPRTNPFWERRQKWFGVILTFEVSIEMRARWREQDLARVCNNIDWYIFSTLHSNEL